MKYYQRPTENFFILPNNILDLRLEPIQFAIYSYLISCSGSKGYCWPSQGKIRDKTSVGLSSVQKHLKILEQRQLIEIRKSRKGSDHQSDDYYPLSLDNPEIYQDLTSLESEGLPLIIGGDLPA